MSEPPCRRRRGRCPGRPGRCAAPPRGRAASGAVPADPWPLTTREDSLSLEPAPVQKRSNWRLGRSFRKGVRAPRCTVLARRPLSDRVCLFVWTVSPLLRGLRRRWRGRRLAALHSGPRVPGRPGCRCGRPRASPAPPRPPACATEPIRRLLVWCRQCFQCRQSTRLSPGKRAEFKAEERVDPRVVTFAWVKGRH